MRRPKTRILPPAQRASWAQTSDGFCAICASTKGPFAYRPLGKDGALVRVCGGCDEEAPRAFVRDRGYEPTGGLPSVDQATAGARRAMGDARYERDTEIDQKLGMQPAASELDDQDYIAFRLETGERIRSKSNEIRSHKSRKEKHTL